MKVFFLGSAIEPLDYQARQKRANALDVGLYVEQHFNSSISPTANYAMVVVGSNASEKSKRLGRRYAELISNRFGIPIGGNGGILIGGYNGRGDANIRHTEMPALLLEPMFCSNPESAELIRSLAGQTELANILADVVREADVDSVAFSIGHKYKKSSPRDRGAALHGGGTEADYAEVVMRLAADLLIAGSVSGGARVRDEEYTVKLGDSLWSIAQAYGQSVEKLQEWNALDGEVIHPGQKLRIQ